MRKIKNRSQLHQTKIELRLQELELEQALHKDWKEIKEKFGAGSESRDQSKTHWLVNGLNVAASSLTHKILERAEKTIQKKISHVLDKRAK
ncbi:MAG: hypothetical protein JST75_11700 [Bacteroidetes bacterium]|nr:hypothetical protein [Bacteroidota bacterium]